MSCIIGIGVDIIEISRFERMAHQEDNGVASRLFTSYELSEAPFVKKAQYFASRFAAKEAVMKALGMGMSNIGFEEIEISKDDFGRPHVTLYGNANKRYCELGGKNILISISHSRELAIAYANLIGDEPR